MARKARQGCWTCKHRKIGCDKTEPNCRNCIRTGRSCLGYGLRLTWPDSPDGRRKGGGSITHVLSPGHSIPRRLCGSHFLNTTYEDFALAQLGPGARSLPLGRPRCSLSIHTPLSGQDGMFLRYYESIISPMVSTTRARNSFTTEILPRALSNKSLSATALCNATLAISAFHLFSSEAALLYKSKAVWHLSKSLSSATSLALPEATETQLAACMMLFMYSVFDDKEPSWHIHLDGAKRMLDSFNSTQASLSSVFLPYWFLYYQVLKDFTRPTQESPGSGAVESLWLWQLPGPDRSWVIGYLGCSIEVFEVLSKINRMRLSSGYKDSSSPLLELTKCRNILELRLNNLLQFLDPEEEHSTTPIERARILAKAELYRLAALLYLLRVCPADGDGIARNAYLDQAHKVLDMLPVVSSPWPLFIVACESQTDEQRVIILRVLDEMEKARNIGNIHVARRIIEMFWKQKDLQGPGSRLMYWHLIDRDDKVPWFA
ncbi:Transcriptional regulatory protein moc3 [Fusarium keratoplasticum]|uniref:Transcriptional regulatory protein moc3 n=1 Tax=Fusarium keratoplasticum TaxID=1328300 RepID=A0ACC0QK31_9HYPO|nr:Transcriptional regulatory protein moc3 [Fusarium keratoplasticum]KAI8657158.1 Transcriptional regulatory protein moc3 [Fusarium keratoplasticum]